jgi:spore coat protein U-like protein
MFKLKFLIIFFLLSFNLQFAKAELAAKVDIVSKCTVSTPSFSFDQYKPAKTESNSVIANVTVSCSNMRQDIPYSLSLDKPKQLFIMSKGNEIMYYQLFTSANYATLWDDTNVISGIIKNNNGFGSDTKTIYGKILRNDIGKRTSAYNVSSDPVIINLYYLP